MCAQAFGTSFGPAIGGWIAQGIEYSATFIILGCFALGSVALWIGFRHVVTEAARLSPEDPGATLGDVAV
jgi:MFS family permease